MEKWHLHVTTLIAFICYSVQCMYYNGINYYRDNTYHAKAVVTIVIIVTDNNEAELSCMQVIYYAQLQFKWTKSPSLGYIPSPPITTQNLMINMNSLTLRG